MTRLNNRDPHPIARRLIISALDLYEFAPLITLMLIIVPVMCVSLLLIMIKRAWNIARGVMR